MTNLKGEWHTPQERSQFRTEMIKKLERCAVLEPLPEKISYFNNPKTHKKVCMYDVAFNPEPGYNQYIHRDDRQQLSIIRENIFEQEKHKRVPVLTSLNYARPWAKRVDPLHTKYFMCSGISEFGSRTGINIAPDLEKQCMEMF